jgi:hypothetical protein
MKEKERKKTTGVQNTTPLEQNVTVSQNEKTDSQQILDRLNSQLLISVIIYFVGSWVYLNNKICSFTGFEPHGVQMSYIYVHYILSVTLLLCVILTAIKSYYMLRTVSAVKEWLVKLFKFFLETWYWILGLCFVSILCSGLSEYEWLISAVVLMVLIIFKLKDNGFRFKCTTLIITILIFFFPIFISSMTAIIKNVEIKADKPFYAFSEKVYLTVSARGYACNHKLVGLGEHYKGVKYYNEKGLIVLNATQISNNEIAIATITPVTGGFLNFFYYYPRHKILGEKHTYMDINPNDITSIKRYADFTPYSIYVKP